MGYKQMRGYVLENKNIHVCGYTSQSILIQDKTNSVYGKDIAMESFKLYTNTKGVFFNLRGKRVFVNRI